MKNYKKILAVFLFLLVGFFIFYGTASASIFGGLDTARETAGYSEDTNIYSTISLIISVALGFVGVAFLGLTLYGGLIWMLARGNEQEIEKAKRLIEAAVIGLAIVFAAYAITYFVTEKILSSTSGGGEGFTCAEGEVSCSCSGDSYPESLCAPRAEDCVCTSF